MCLLAVLITTLTPNGTRSEFSREDTINPHSGHVVGRALNVREDKGVLMTVCDLCKVGGS